MCLEDLVPERKEEENISKGHTIVYIKQRTNKDLPFSIENSTQYSVISYKGKKSEKE